MIPPFSTTPSTHSQISLYKTRKLSSLSAPLIFQLFLTTTNVSTKPFTTTITLTNRHTTTASLPFPTNNLPHLPRAPLPPNSHTPTLHPHVRPPLPPDPAIHPSLAWKCPICRTSTTEIHHSSAPDGTYLTHSRTSISPSISHGPFILPDEELSEDMNAEQRERALELRKLRRLGEWSTPLIVYELPHAYVLEGERFVLVQKSLKLKIEQSDLTTKPTLFRNLRIATVRLGYPLLEGMETELIPVEDKEVVRARREVEGILEGLGRVGKEAGKVVCEFPEVFFINDGRGLDVLVEKTVSVVQSKGVQGVDEIVKVERMTELREKLPSRVVGREVWERLDREFGGGVERGEREVVVQGVREEMRGVIEKVRGVIDGRWVERAMTGILDAGDGVRGECEFCPEAHRNGDCWFPGGTIAVRAR